MTDTKIVVAGTCERGKAQVLSILSAVPPYAVSHVSDAHDQPQALGQTAELSCGHRDLPDGELLKVYSMPRNPQFAFLLPIITDDALGVILVNDNASTQPMAALEAQLAMLVRPLARGGVVLGITGLRESPWPTLDDYYAELERRAIWLPAMPLDTRRKDHAILLCELLFQQLESAMLAESSPLFTTC